MPSTNSTHASKTPQGHKSKTPSKPTGRGATAKKTGDVPPSSHPKKRKSGSDLQSQPPKKNTSSGARPSKSKPDPPPRFELSDEDDGDQDVNETLPSSSPPPPKRTRVTKAQPSSRAWENAMDSLDPNAKAETRSKEGFEVMYWNQRQISRLVGLKVNWINSVSTGIAYYGVGKSRNPYWKCTEYDDIVEAVDVFKIIAEFWPMMTFNLCYLGERHDLIDHMAHFCDKVSIKVRGDDLARVKPHMPKIAGFKDPELIDKSNRGWNHDETAAALAPKRYHEHISADVTLFRRKVKSCEILIHSEDWPLVFYDKDLMKPGQYKPGLFRSPEMIKMARALFTSKTALDEDIPYDGKSKGQPPIAKKYNMKDITFRGVVYVACLLRFLLTSYSDWTEMDGEHWNLDDFLYSIYDFAHKNWDWQTELLSWWNRKLFGGVNVEDEKVEADRKLSAYHLAIEKECTGHRMPPSDDEDEELGLEDQPFNGEDDFGDGADGAEHSANGADGDNGEHGADGEHDEE